MKVEFELNLDRNGNPCIKFRHHDKSNSLEQKMLKTFIDSIKERGCILKHVSGYLESGTPDSWENYEIQIRGYHCPDCKGTSITSNCCENPDCPNMPCCGNSKEECKCNL